MAERSSARGSAQDRLQRILYLLPAAGSEEGASIESLCDALGVTRSVLMRDIAEVTARDFYLPAGLGDSLRITIEADRVRVWTKGDFRRPPKLTPREKLALDLGLRILAAEREGEEREGLLALAGRLESTFASIPEIEFAPPFAIDEAAMSDGAGPPAGTGSPGPDAPAEGTADGPLRGRLIEAARERRPCQLRYLKSGATEPETRRLEPYVLVASTGHWYAVGRDPDRDGIRVFRLDRILDARVADGRFEPDPGFDLDHYLTGSYVYRAPADGHEGAGEEGVPPLGPSVARIRYSPRIARWFEERGEGEIAEDGSVTVEREAGDEVWVARHVLRYGGDAELLGPDELRRRVAEGARGVERAHSEPASTTGGGDGT